jgi:aryl-alcohol dehydrogenase-like predicted oxidoreductase
MLCRERGIAMLPWFGLAAGFLTGKYRTREDLAKHNRGSSIERFFDKGLKVLPALDAVAAETGASLGAVALAWLMRQPGIAAPIASASKPEQLDIQFEALTLELSDDQLARLTAAGA